LKAEILLGIALFALCISVYYNYKFARIILNFEDRIEGALDDLDARYKKMSEIIRRPIFFDSVEVRQVIAEITEPRDTNLRIANGIAKVGESNDRAAG